MSFRATHGPPLPHLDEKLYIVSNFLDKVIKALSGSVFIHPKSFLPLLKTMTLHIVYISYYECDLQYHT